MVFNNLVHNYYTIIKHVQIVYRVSASQATRPQRSVGYSNEFLAFIYVYGHKQVLWKMHTWLEACRVDSLNLVSTQCQRNGKSMRNQSHWRPFFSFGTYVNTCMHKNVAYSTGAYMSACVCVCVGVRVCVCKEQTMLDIWHLTFCVWHWILWLQWLFTYS